MVFKGGFETDLTMGRLISVEKVMEGVICEPNIRVTIWQT